MLIKFDDYTMWIQNPEAPDHFVGKLCDRAFQFIIEELEKRYPYTEWTNDVRNTYFQKDQEERFGKDLLKIQEDDCFLQYLFSLQWDASTALGFLNRYLVHGGVIRLSLPELEKLRMDIDMCGCQKDFTAMEVDRSLLFPQVKTLQQVIVAILYFYAFTGRKMLKRCKLCGKWFLTDDPRPDFCPYPFSYLDYKGQEHSYPSCTDARTRIANRHREQRRKVYKSLYQTTTDEVLNSVLEKAEDFLAEIRQKPSIENFLKYETYLYVDCKKITDEHKGGRNRK